METLVRHPAARVQVEVEPGLHPHELGAKERREPARVRPVRRAPVDPDLVQPALVAIVQATEVVWKQRRHVRHHLAQPVGREQPQLGHWQR